jgi:YD repeat-containing protein
MNSLKRLQARRLPLASALALVLLSITASAQVQNSTTKYEYDAAGNLTKITNPLLAVTSQSYDALNRLKSQTDPNNKITQFSYNGQDQLTQVTDARNLSTLYTVDGLGNQLGLTSPDTGNSTSTVDAAGNILTRTNAKGQTTSYQYDILNRVSRITYADGSTITYLYDQGSNGKGRLSQINDALGSIQYSYDSRGRILSQLQTLTVNGSVQSTSTSYTYDAAGRLLSITYPNTRRLTYTRDSIGRITQIDTSKDGISTTLLSQVSYRPFGGVQSYLNSIGQAYTRGFDLDGRITSYTLNNQVQAITYDAASRIIGINQLNDPNRQATYGYDKLDRLISYLSPQVNQNFSYDPVGNRTSQTNGSASTNYTYGTTSNRLTQVAGSQTTSIAIDANGSITNNGAAQFNYDARGRLISASTASGTVQYQINALGQRVQKIRPGGGAAASTVYYYDQSGQLISEITGSHQIDYIYLDNIPVALLK